MLMLWEIVCVQKVDTKTYLSASLGHSNAMV